MSTMNPIDLKPTATTPAISFSDAKLMIKGRSIPLSGAAFYDLYIEWATTVEISKLTLDINLEYMNSSSSKKLLQLFKALDTNNKIGKLLINWFFEEGDDESEENGHVFKTMLRNADFHFIKFR
jgi:hypothetical protein